MLLHQNKDDFKTLVSLVSDHYGLRDYQVEKDYYVSVLLKKLTEEASNIQLVFKGGTSLSKCYKVINRFSEDIDLTIMTNHNEVTVANRRELKNLIITTIENNNMLVVNQDEIRSRRDFNSYKIKFDNTFEIESDVVSNIVIETIVTYRPYPTQKVDVSNFITNYLIEMYRPDIVEKYNLFPFQMVIQSIERTFIDKLFAVCDYHLLGKYERYSRHLYDIHMIWISSQLNIDLLRSIVLDVIRDRQSYVERNPSSKIGTLPNKILKEIIEKDVYKKDYLNITNKLIYIPEPYENCTKSILEIIEKKIIPDVIY